MTKGEIFRMHLVGSRGFVGARGSRPPDKIKVADLVIGALVMLGTLLGAYATYRTYSIEDTRGASEDRRLALEASFSYTASMIALQNIQHCLEYVGRSTDRSLFGAMMRDLGATLNDPEIENMDHLSICLGVDSQTLMERISTQPLPAGDGTSRQVKRLNISQPEVEKILANLTKLIATDDQILEYWLYRVGNAKVLCEKVSPWYGESGAALAKLLDDHKDREPTAQTLVRRYPAFIQFRLIKNCAAIAANGSTNQ